VVDPFRLSRIVHLRAFVSLCLILGSVCLSTLCTGCATSDLDRARRLYYQGEFDAGASVLSNATSDVTTRVLVLMERGMMHQARGDYTESTLDWLDAHELAEYLDYYSISRGSASLMINDEVLAFRGRLYERVLLNAFAAQSYLALGLWDDAGVEARNIIAQLESREKFPDDAYSRYVAGFALESTGDADGARVQYRTAAELLDGIAVDPGTGALGRSSGPGNTVAREGLRRSSPTRSEQPAELVCFVGFGGAPNAAANHADGHRWGSSPYAEIHANGRYLGRSYTLNTTPALRSDTEDVLELQQEAKTAVRVALKETASELVAQQDEALGDLLRILLFALETEDDRQWETLPRWLQVARVPCPADLYSYTIVFFGAGGRRVEQRVVTAPLSRRGRFFASFCRAL